jgi:aspartate beta-hydroxylase
LLRQTLFLDQASGLGHDRGDWNVYYLHLHNADYSMNRARCPVTCAILDGIPRNYSHSFFSAVAPGTHIAKHNGPTNKKLRCHLPLVVPASGEARIRVGDVVIPFEEGRCFVFDDSFEHEVWNETGRFLTVCACMRVRMFVVLSLV